MMELHVCDGRGTTLRVFALGDTPELLVGRDDSCDVRIAARSVSREHCVIECDGQDFFIRDLDSTSGTIVRGQPVNRMRVESGIEVDVGPARLRFIEAS